MHCSVPWKKIIISPSVPRLRRVFLASISRAGEIARPKSISRGNPVKRNWRKPVARSMERAGGYYCSAVRWFLVPRAWSR